MSCPYSEPSCPRELPAHAAACPTCRRFVKSCRQCGAPNRAFANFCRACGEPAGAAEGNWLGYKGGIRRLGSQGASRHPLHRVETVDTGLELRLGDICRSLLAVDGHLVALSQNGTIEIADPRRPAATQRFQAQGPISAEPCIDRGVLYVGSRGQVSAYSLGTTTLAAPKLRQLWRTALDGAPIQALTPVGDSLFVTVATDGRREVQVIDDVRRAQPAAARTICLAPRVSWIAADASRREVVFLSDDGRGVQVHVAGPERVEVSSRPVALGAFADHPIAFLGGKVFALFDDARLYRIDPDTGGIDETLSEDTQLFSLTHDEGEWDRDEVYVDGSGVLFSQSGVKDTFSHLDRAMKGSPVIADRRAVAVGMEDGRVLLYDLQRLPRHDVWRLDGAAGAPITALASFDSFIAAGNRDGIVGVREIRAMAGAS